MAVAKARTIADFRSVHDKNVIIPNKIRAALEAMRKIGPEHYEYEADFIKLAGISNTDMGSFRDQFLAHIVETPNVRGNASRRVWFADAKVAKKLREA